MSTEQNKTLICRVFEEGVSGGDMRLIDEVFSPHNVSHSGPPGQYLSPERIRAFLAGVRATLPDLQVTIEELIAEDDRVATVETWRGTHARTGERVEGTVLHVFRFADGQVVEEWNEGWGWWERVQSGDES
jgi:predicted ester cyclase